MNKAAKIMLSNGLNPLPVDAIKKSPICKWKEYQTNLIVESEINTLFQFATGIACIAGKVSGNLECLDFDCKGLLFESWAAAVARNNEDLFFKLVVSQTQSGGYHVIYRSEFIEGNKKILTIAVDGKPTTAIETRGQGGYFLVPPSPNYKWIQGDATCVPTITASERELLFECCRSPEVMAKLQSAGLAESPPNTPLQTNPVNTGLSPLDSIFPNGLDVKALKSFGWTLVDMDADGIHERWRRPNKAQGISASRNKNNGIFYCFSSNGHPFEQNNSYSAANVYSMLHNNGDIKATAHNLYKQGYGQFTPVVNTVVNNDIPDDWQSEEYEVFDGEVSNTNQYVSDELLDVEGFINEFKDFTKQFSLWNQPEIFFTSGLVFLSFLTSRRIADEWDNRPILYIDVVAVTGSGKGSIDSAISKALDDYQQLKSYRNLSLHKTGKIASRAALDKMLIERKRVLVVWDEYGDTLKVSIKKPSSFTYDLISYWTELFSVANRQSYTPTITVGNLKLKKGKIQSVSQPHVTFCGLTNPKDYQAALVGDLLSSGYIARRFVTWGRNTHEKNGIQSNIETPTSILDKMYLWDFVFAPVDERDDGEKIDEGNESKVSGINPTPKIIPTSDEAKEKWQKLLDILVAYIDSKNCPAGFKEIAVRVYEKAHSLALLKASSRVNSQADLDSLVIESADVKWAFYYTTFNAVHFYRWSKNSVIDSPVGSKSYENAALSVKMINWFKINIGKRMSKKQIALKFCNYTSKDRLMVLDNLEEQGQLNKITEGDGVRKTTFYTYDFTPELSCEELLKQIREA